MAGSTGNGNSLRNFLGHSRPGAPLSWNLPAWLETAWGASGRDRCPAGSGPRAGTQAKPHFMQVF